MNTTDSLWRRYRDLDTRNPYLTPAIATLFFMLFLVLDLQVKPEPDTGFVQENSFGMFLAMLQILPIVFFRRAPLAALSVIFLAFVAHATYDYATPWTVQFSTMIGLYLVASTTDDRQSIIAGLLTIVAIVGVFGIIQDKTDNAIALVLLFTAVWIAGNIVRARRSRLEIAELTVAELSDEQDRAAREAVSDERARIARELHDVLGHTLNLVVIQAGAAQRVFDSAPDKALETMQSIESTSRQALSDVDRMLGILRNPDDAVGTAPSLKARPSMTRLSSLVEDLRSTGQAIELVTYGTVFTLPPSIDLTAYRVVQEALTNVMTHAQGSTAQVEIEYAEDRLKVTISNDGSGIDTLEGRPRGGRGVVGMRERTSLFGGTFEAARSDDGGWRVHAVFPIGTGSSGGGVK